MPTVLEARSEIEAGRVSAVELTEEALAAIDRGRALNAYLHVDAEGALEAARQADAALEDAKAHPLAGIPICVKDMLHVSGMPTTAGAKGWVRHPTSDAPAVARLRAAGAVIVGKGNTNEFAFGIDGQNEHWGDCHNPHDPSRMSGGSTSGPATAAATGQAVAGIGTDTSGSLRAPASFCGLVSIRPTPGVVPTEGVVPLAWSYDTVGPIARTVADASLLLEVLTGGRGEPAPDQALTGVRVGLLEQFLGEDCSRGIAEAVRDAADRMASEGADVRPVAFPRLEEIGDAHRAIQFSEAAATHRPWFDDQRLRYEAGVRERIETGAALPAPDYVLARRTRAFVQDETAVVMSDLDVLIAPAMPVVAPPLGAEDVDIDGRSVPLRPALLTFTMPLTQPGGPVVAVPLGEADGLPFGLQIMGKPGADRQALGIAAAFRRLSGVGTPEP